MRTWAAIGVLIVAAMMPFGGLQGSEPGPDADALRLNQIQVVGTHNSYQQPMDARVANLMLPRLYAHYQHILARLSADQRATMLEEHPTAFASAKAFADAMHYIQMPIEAQLAAGVRAFELDLNADPDGGRFLDPLPHRVLRAAGAVDLAPIQQVELQQAGTKVFHIADVDFRSQCPRFRQCLSMLRHWSDANPGHSPVFVLLEPKFGGLDGAIEGATKVAPFDQRAFDEVDADVIAVLGRDRLFTPDQLRGKYGTLEEAVLARQWPTIAETRGKFLFLYIVPGLNLATFAPYLKGRPSLEGRIAFVQGLPGMAHAAFLMVDNAMAKPGRVAELVRKGYLVKSRADIDTWDARTNDPKRRDATLAEGAQIIATDFPFAPNIYGNNYHVPPFAGGFRANPVTGRCARPC
jgi:Phosphoinositide phospholipase C, Ca2+-dependent